MASTLDERLARGDEPESLDKEPFRLALAATGFRGEGEPPVLPPEVLIETAARYISAFEKITGEALEPGTYPVQRRLDANLRGAGIIA